MNQAVQEFQIPDEYIRPHRQTHEESPEPASAPAAENQVAVLELPQLCAEIMHIGNWLDYERNHKLKTDPYHNLNGILRVLSKPRTKEGLMSEEIKLTSNIFGQPSGDQRYDFFYYGPIDKNCHEWIFHNWRRDNNKDWEVSTTRYLVKPRNILRAQELQPYVEVSGEEANRLRKAASTYYAKVKSGLYS